MKWLFPHSLKKYEADNEQQVSVSRLREKDPVGKCSSSDVRIRSERNRVVSEAHLHPNVPQTRLGTPSVMHKKKPRLRSASPQEKMWFLSKQKKLESTIKSPAARSSHRVWSVIHTKTNWRIFTWITDEKIVKLPNIHSLRIIRKGCHWLILGLHITQNRRFEYL